MDIKLGTVLIFGVITQILGWRPFKVELHNLIYELLHPEIIDVNVTLKNKVFVDLHVNVLKDLPQIFLDFELLHDSGNGKYDMVYANKTVDVCMFLNNRKLNIFFDIIYRTFSDHMDLPKKCPIRKKQYDLRNVFIDPEKFPPFMPDHKAKMSGIAWYKQHGKKDILSRGSCNVVVERSFKNNGKE